VHHASLRMTSSTGMFERHMYWRLLVTKYSGRKFNLTWFLSAIIRPFRAPPLHLSLPSHFLPHWSSHTRKKPTCSARNAVFAEVFQSVVSKLRSLGAFPPSPLSLQLVRRIRRTLRCLSCTPGWFTSIQVLPVIQIGSPCIETKLRYKARGVRLSVTNAVKRVRRCERVSLRVSTSKQYTPLQVAMHDFTTAHTPTMLGTYLGFSFDKIVERTVRST